MEAKTFTKILAKRLESFIHQFIHRSQSGFLKERLTRESIHIFCHITKKVCLSVTGLVNPLKFPQDEGRRRGAPEALLKELRCWDGMKDGVHVEREDCSVNEDADGLNEEDGYPEATEERRAGTEDKGETAERCT
ncbi:hypothetical protein NDU88_003637 [Pleurodeles waltl]|uniref:Reverse transcriptase domain-containing protein n=1 Tax=Pleurodeles waltl TaxID=8319 RepID=A0AAV7UGV3_PLEWA|nr:hypothetical protein NDU88_003637 [Pleurodeles waltl]